ncbi:hypothetical protein DAI22_02g258300 [Oryza sativa Japonica Group]|nr:hypothetical protein DAI22_02g258300 [Oryza sativa Japonica Group]KAF2945985.1 hypothetical protein DAI22_02g258300 [Oryza sativa Japonica Group]
MSPNSVECCGRRSAESGEPLRLHHRASCSAVNWWPRCRGAGGEREAWSASAVGLLLFPGAIRRPVPPPSAEASRPPLWLSRLFEPKLGFWTSDEIKNFNRAIYTLCKGIRNVL